VGALASAHHKTDDSSGEAEDALDEGGLPLEIRASSATTSRKVSAGACAEPLARAAASKSAFQK
jgi:hypothetical protein